MKFITAALLGLATVQAFPSFDSFHAHCQTEMQVDAPCNKVIDDLNKWVAAGKDVANPPGHYSAKQSTDKLVWAERKTANGKYVDDVQWETTAGTATSCTISGKSKSQSLSYYDYNVNFCNMYNPIRDLYKTDIATVKNSNCRYPAKDAKTCDRY